MFICFSGGVGHQVDNPVRFSEGWARVPGDVSGIWCSAAACHYLVEERQPSSAESCWNCECHSQYMLSVDWNETWAFIRKKILEELIIQKWIVMQVFDNSQRLYIFNSSRFLKLLSSDFIIISEYTLYI